MSLVYVEKKEENYPSTRRAVDVSLFFFLNLGINRKWHKPPVSQWELLYFRKTFDEAGKQTDLYQADISVS